MINYKELNVTFIKNIMYDEIQKYYEVYNKTKTLNFEIAIIDNMINLIKQSKFNQLFNEILNFEILLKENTMIHKELLNNVYYYLFFINEVDMNATKPLHTEKIKYAKDKLVRFSQELENIKSSKIKELSKLDVSISYELCLKYKNIMKTFKDGDVIRKEQYELIIELLKKHNFSDKEIIILLEKVKIHNIHSNLRNSNQKFDPFEAYKVIDILSMGYEEIELPYTADMNKGRAENIIYSCSILLEDLNYGGLNLLLPKYDNNNIFSNGISKDEFEYIMKSLLLKYQDLLYNYSKDLNQLVNYQDKELRNLITDEFQKYLAIYKYLRNHMDSEIEKYNLSITTDDEQYAPDAIELYYSLREGQAINTYFESDLKDIPNDLYDEIKDLLTRFKKGTLSQTEMKILTGPALGMNEIKKDQIRIMFKHIEKNKYVIVGIFLKKSDNLLKEYVKMNERQSTYYIAAEECEPTIFKIIDEEKHYGGRINS